MFFDRLLTVSVKDVLTEFFESETMQGAYAQAQDAGDLNAPGSAWAYTFIKCGNFTKPENNGIVKGGMGGITQAMAASARARGATLQTDATIDHIIVEDGTACGVALADGTEIRSRIVVSNADPKRTFLKLVPREHLSPQLRRKHHADENERRLSQIPRCAQ